MCLGLVKKSCAVRRDLKLAHFQGLSGFWMRRAVFRCLNGRGERVTSRASKFSLLLRKKLQLESLILAQNERWRQA